MLEPVGSVPLDVSIMLYKFSGWKRYNLHLRGQGYRDGLTPTPGQVAEQT